VGFLKFLSKPVSRGLSFKRLYKERQNVKEPDNSENGGFPRVPRILISFIMAIKGI